VIIPTFSERESNARRIASLGAGEFILPKTNADGMKLIDINLLRKKVKEVLATPTYRESAKKYGEVLRSYGGIDGAVDLIENMDSAGRAEG